MRIEVLAACLAASLAGVAAQAGPKVAVKVPRAAMADWRLGTVAFVPQPGDCAQQVQASVTQLLASRQVSAGPVDLRALLSDSEPSLPTFLGPTEVQSLGKHVGADTLFVIRLARCGYPERTSSWAHPRDWLGIEDKKVIEYSVTTRASISGTLQALDLKSGRISKALPLEAFPVVTQKSREGYPEGVSVDEIQRQAVGMIAAQVEHVFLPWTEERELVFFDDKDCDLKQAAVLLKAGDLKGAVEQSRRNVEACRANPKAKDKHRRRALHNLATGLFASDDAAAAVPIFEEALRLGGDEEQKEGLDARSALQKLKDDARQVEPKIAAAMLTGELRRTMCRVAAIAMILTASAVGRAAEIAPGALVSSEGRVAYLRVPAGALEARSVTDGALLWRADEDLRPLADGRGGRLLCQRGGPEGRLDLVFLDTADGRRRGETTVALPPRVPSPLDERLGARFDLTAVADGARVRLVWSFERRPVRGTHFEAERGEAGEEAGEVVRAEGAVAVDLDVERATPVPGTLLPAAVEARVPWGELRVRPLAVGAYLVATAKTGDGPALARWTASGQALPPVALPAGVTLQLGSADGRHVPVSRERPGAPYAEAHEWTVIALDTGDVRATLRTSVAAAPFEVARGRTLVALGAAGRREPSGWRDEPRRLHAFDPSGAPVWSWQLQDPAYRGPVAP